MAERTKGEDAQAEIEERLIEAEIRMERSIEALNKELNSIRTGRASPALVDRLQVEVYGVQQQLAHVANINVPDARMLVIQPYDKSTIAAIEKAIARSELGLTPTNDGSVIRISIPPLTEERRREYGKVVRAKAEEARVAVRNIRRDEVDHLRKVEKDGHISKDEVEARIGDLQKITDRFTARVDDIAQRKETEILEV